jgi:hypothetical protein
MGLDTITCLYKKVALTVERAFTVVATAKWWDSSGVKCHCCRPPGQAGMPKHAAAKWCPLVPKFAGSNPAEAVGFFGRKNPQHAFLRRGSKAVCRRFAAC